MSGGGWEGLGKCYRGGGRTIVGRGIFHWGGGAVHHKGGWGMWVYGMGSFGP